MLLTKDFFGLLWILLFSSLQRLQGKEVFTDHRVYAVCSSDLFAALFRHLGPYFCPYGLTLIQTDHTSALFPDFVIRLNWPAIIFILYIKFYSEFIITQFFRLHRTGLRMQFYFAKRIEISRKRNYYKYQKRNKLKKNYGLNITIQYFVNETENITRH